MIGPTLRTMLAQKLSDLLDVDEPGVIQQNVVDRDGPVTRVYFVRRSETRDTYLGGGTGPSVSTFDVEVISPNIATVFLLADKIKTWHGERFETDAAEVMLALIDDQSDDYFVKGVGEDEPVHVVSLDVELTWRAKD